ncbi:MAG TPA: hypothetical protein VNW49_08780 [Puia sp.]|jgi:hypothetical protein|nr:hypothetical protein [Puia sp.]
MTQHFAETLLFTSVAINAALLIFFAGVFRKMMNAVDEATFKNLTELLLRYSSKSPFMILILNIPLLLAIPYFYFYGFSNGWITTGIALWLVSGSVAKIFKLPAYKGVSVLKNDNVVQLNEMRYRINKGNVLQAALYSAAVFLMAFGLH